MLGLQSWPCSLFLLLVLLSASVQTVSLPGQRLQVGRTGRELREVSGVEGQFGEVVFEPGMSGGPKFQLLEAAVYSHRSLPALQSNSLSSRVIACS